MSSRCTSKTTQTTSGASAPQWLRSRIIPTWELTGHRDTIIGYEHTFIHTVKDLLDGISAGESPVPTFEDGYRCQAVLDAVERSVQNQTWTEPAQETVE